MTWSSILVPHDFSASAEHAVQIASREARSHGARLVLLHVVELMPHFGPETTVMLRPGTSTPISVRRYCLETADADLRVVAAPLVTAGLAVDVEVRSGVPVDEIHDFVRTHPIDLVVMGTHGRTGLRHLLVGSVAERVVRGSQVPVITIRHPDHAG